MSEPNTEAPVTESAPTTEAKPVVSSKGLGDRRAAAMAALPEDMAAADREEAKAPPPDVASEEDKPQPVNAVEAPKAEEQPKPEVPDALAARAAADRFLMREREALKAEREAIAKERQEWEAQRKEQPDHSKELESYRRLVSTDLVSVADKEGWTPQQRFEMAKALSWSAHPEDKRPAGWRGNGQGQVMSEVEQVKAELARVKSEQESWKKSQEEAARKQQEQMRDAQLGDAILKALPSDTPYVKAKAEHSPDEVRAHLAHFAKQMIDAERKKAHDEFRDPRILTEADVAKEYERYLTEEYNQKWGWREKVQRPAPAKAATPAQVPPAKALASATPPAPKVTSRVSPQERAKAKAEAMALLPEKLD